jgi:hypothetical protein
MLSVTYKPIMLSVIMLTVTYAECHNAECHFAECRFAECRGAAYYTTISQVVCASPKFTALAQWPNTRPTILRSRIRNPPAVGTGERKRRGKSFCDSVTRLGEISSFRLLYT